MGQSKELQDKSKEARRFGINKLALSLVTVATFAAAGIILRSLRVEPQPADSPATSYDMDDLYNAGL
ncbi:MAG: hypothetical protein IH877_06190 [Gemmatimonadetes bacterium]|nr:hypothetical protein [Gemmatimonadota bacterium]